MKKFLFFILFLLLLLSFNSVLAAPKRAEIKEKIATKTAEKEILQNKPLDNLKQKAIKLIDNRVNSLQRLLERIKNDKKLTEEEKNSLNKDIEDQESALNALKTKIQNDTTAAEVRSDAKKIITDFKIFAVFEPKIRLLITIDNLQSLSTKIGDLSPKIQAKIDEEKAKGKDVGKLQSLLDDINSKLKDINSKLSNDKTKIMAVTPSSANPRQIFVAVRKDLASVRSDFAKIRHDIAQMRKEFNINIKKGAVSPKSSSAPSPTP